MEPVAMRRSNEEVTTLGFYRGFFIAGAIYCWALAVGVAAASITLSIERTSKSHTELYVVIPFVALFASLLTLLGVRIFRTRVTVTPTTLTAYGFQGLHSTFSASKQEIADIQIRQMPSSGFRDAGLAPYVSLHHGGGFWLRALSISARRGGGDTQAAALDRIRSVMGIPVGSPEWQSHVANVSLATGLEPGYPPPQGPPESYDAARDRGRPVPANPKLPAPGSEPGWLIDPVAASGYRYFDGTRWTEWVYKGSYVSVSHLPVAGAPQTEPVEGSPAGE